MALGIMQNDGSNITGFSSAVQPDKQLSRKNTPRVHLAQFGDGYEQRLQDGINSLKQEISVSFQTRPKAEIDDLVAFFESLNGVTKFRFDIADSNASSSTETIKVVCPDWEQKWEYDDYYTLDATFRRVYEA
jgi:phage-related protein|tara:strand:+ start:67 stop:462 length:396 start_codon:yes stop_codon:yes gene_type:complete